MAARKLGVNDCQAVANLERQLFNGRFDAKSVRLMLVNPAFYGAVLPLNSTTSAISTYCLSYITVDYAEIIAIGTGRKWWGRGFARIILKHLIEHAEQQCVYEIFLEVAADNIPARQLYGSCGFVETGRRKNYYRQRKSPCDAIIMTRLGDTTFS